VSYETLLVETRDGVATLTLNRPDARNALNQTMVRELGAALAELEASPEARVVVIRGAGERAFCAGADLRGMFRTGSPMDARAQYAGLARVLEAIPRMRAPVIAQVHGHALAGGCGLAAACDLVIAADDAVFGLPEIKLGLLPLMVLAPILQSVASCFEKTESSWSPLFSTIAIYRAILLFSCSLCRRLSTRLLVSLSITPAKSLT